MRRPTKATAERWRDVPLLTKYGGVYETENECDAEFVCSDVVARSCDEPELTELQALQEHKRRTQK